MLTKKEGGRRRPALRTEIIAGGRGTAETTRAVMTGPTTVRLTKTVASLFSALSP